MTRTLAREAVVWRKTVKPLISDSCGFVLVLSLRIIFLMVQMHLVGVFLKYCPLIQGESIQAVVCSKLQMSGMIQEFLQRMFQKSVCSFSKPVPISFFFHGASRIKISCWDTLFHLFPHLSSSSKATFPGCFIRFINYCFGHGPLWCCWGCWRLQAELTCAPAIPKGGIWCSRQFQMEGEPFGSPSKTHSLQLSSSISPKWKSSRAKPVQFYLNFDDLGLVMAFDFLIWRADLCLWLFQNYFCWCNGVLKKFSVPARS